MNIARRVLDYACLTPLAVCGIALLILLPYVPPFNQEYIIRWLVQALILGGLAMSFDFSGGYIGIVNFGFNAFVGIGSYTAALTSIHFGLSPWVGLFIGVLPAALSGFAMGVISLRLRGMFAICLTWFFALAMHGLATKMVWLTRGALGLRCPFLFDTSSNVPYYYVGLVIVLITYIVLRRVVNSYMGMAFRAIGQNLDVARTSGIFPARYRVINFTLSCAFAGWIGSFYAYYYGVLTPDVMHTNKTVEVLVISYIGGRGTLWGGVVAAFPFVIGMELLRSTFANLPGLNLALYGLFLILIMIFYPDGVAKLYRTLLASSRNGMVRKLVRQPVA